MPLNFFTYQKPPTDGELEPLSLNEQKPAVPNHESPRSRLLISSNSSENTNDTFSLIRSILVKLEESGCLGLGKCCGSSIVILGGSLACGVTGAAIIGLHGIQALKYGGVSLAFWALLVVGILKMMELMNNLSWFISSCNSTALEKAIINLIITSIFITGSIMLYLNSEFVFTPFLVGFGIISVGSYMLYKLSMCARNCFLEPPEPSVVDPNRNVLTEIINDGNTQEGAQESTNLIGSSNISPPSYGLSMS